MPRVSALRDLLIVCTLCLLVAASACGGGETPLAGETKILIGPRFWTGDPANPWAEAVEVRGGRIQSLFSRAQIPKMFAGGGTVISLPGKVAVPGLVDAHAHIRGYGLTLQRADLVGCAPVEQCLERVVAFAQAHPEQPWIEGRGWDQNDWPTLAWPDADRLEQVIPSRPVALRRVDGHALWANRTALAEAGIDDETPDPSGGKIHRDRNGRATGILVDEAMSLVLDRIPKLSTEVIERALEDAAKDLLAVGLTGVHDMGVGTETWAAMKKLAAEGRFPLSVFAYAGVDTDLYKQLLETGPQHEGRLHLVGVKIYADGALGSRGARLLEPYDDEPNARGLWITGPEALREEFERAAAAGLQPAVHAIGDAANRAVLDQWELVLGSQGAEPALPLRLEHVQIMSPEDQPRVSQLGVIASMQPTHATSDMPWAERRVGQARLAGAYSWRTMLKSGAVLSFGSDFPIESIDPRKGLYAAVTRQDLEGNPAGGWLPEQRLTFQQALAAFTSGAAKAVGREDDNGTLAPGRYADITVFEEELLDVSPEAIVRTRITATVIGGSVYLPGRD